MLESTLYETLVHIHLVAGIVALVAFWAQMATRKRGTLHRRVGQTYFAAMAGVVVTALPMTVFISLSGRWGTAMLLGFVSWITISAGVSAWWAARWRQRRLVLQRRFHRGAAWGLLMVSLILLAFLQKGGGLFAGLGAFGIYAAWNDLRRPADHVEWQSWRYRHIVAVMGTGIAVHVAFFSFGLARWLGENYQASYFLIAFGVPVILGAWATHHFTRRYVGGARGLPPEGLADGAS